MAKQTTVQLEPGTRDRLKQAGVKGETYDQVMNRLLDFWEQEHKGGLRGA